MSSLYPALRPAGLELVGVASRHAEGASTSALAFGAGPGAGFDTVGALLAATEPAGVIVCVPAAAYRDVVLECVAGGVPVFCEKPGAASSAELAEIEAAAAGGVPVMVGYMKRFAPAYRRAVELVAADEFGPVTSVHAQFLMGPGFGSIAGYVIDNPVHMLDMLRAVAGEVVDVNVFATTNGTDRHAIALGCTFENGAVGTAQFTTTFNWDHEGERLDVVGTGASVTVTNVDTVTYRPAGGAAIVERPTYTVPLDRNFTGTTMGFVPELAHFKAVVTEGVPCLSDVASARRTLDLAERVLREHQSGVAVGREDDRPA